MRALIGPDLVRKLPAKNVDIRDTSLVGYLVRCRASGQHTYFAQLGRHRRVTLGRVGELAPEQARLTAQALLGGVSRDALKILSDDPTMNHREAMARARTAVRPHAGRRLTFGRYLTDHYEPWALQTLKSGREAVRRLRVNFAEFADQPLAQFSGFAIERWRVARLKTGVTPATVNRDLAGLRGALSKAREDGVLRGSHPMERVRAAQEDRIGRLRYLAADEHQRLLAALEARDTERRHERDTANRWREERGKETMPRLGTYTDCLHPLVVLALRTGLRFGELTGLRWPDVNLSGAMLTVRGEGAKSGRTRHVPLNATAVRVLMTWRDSSTSAALVFPGPDDETRITDIKTAWGSLLKRARIEGFRFHDCRHTFASWLVQAGVDLNRVRTLLGHANLEMTLRYAHLGLSDTAAAVAKLPA